MERETLSSQGFTMPQLYVEPRKDTPPPPTMIEHPEIQVVQTPLKKTPEIIFDTEKIKNSTQIYIKENKFFQDKPNIKEAALNYTDVLYYGTKILKNDLEVIKETLIPASMLVFHVATGDVPLAVATGVSLGVKLVKLIPSVVDKWKNAGKMAVSAVKTGVSLTKSILGVFKS